MLGTTAALIAASPFENQDPSESGCDFDVVDLREMKPAEFRANYVAKNKPALLRGGMDSSAWEVLRNNWGLESLSNRELKVVHR